MGRELSPSLISGIGRRGGVKGDGANDSAKPISASEAKKKKKEKKRKEEYKKATETGRIESEYHMYVCM